MYHRKKKKKRDQKTLLLTSFPGWLGQQCSLNWLNCWIRGRHFWQECYVSDDCLSGRDWQYGSAKRRKAVMRTLFWRILMMMTWPGNSSSLAFGVCFLGSIVLCLLWRCTPLFLKQDSLRFTALDVKCIDFHGNLYRFLIYISRLLVVISETWR